MIKNQERVLQLLVIRHGPDSSEGRAFKQALRWKRSEILRARQLWEEQGLPELGFLW